MPLRYTALIATGLVFLTAAALGCGSTKHRIIQDDTSLVIVSDSDESIPIEIHFETDSHVLKESSHAPLDALADFLSTRDDYGLIEVQGHSDPRGDEAYNRALSKRRADAVVDYLVAQGVDRGSLRARGFGSTRPAAPGADESAWRANRRVEFVIAE